MKIKPNTYYKNYFYDINDPSIKYREYYSNTDYDIVYTGNKWVYYIASKYNDTPLIKYDKKIKWRIIKRYQEFINDNNYKIEELSKEDVFLELL